MSTDSISSTAEPIFTRRGLLVVIDIDPAHGGTESLAALVFFRDAKTPFTDDDESLLKQVSPIFAVSLATLTTNVAANLVSPSYDFSNAWPKGISFRTGGRITASFSIICLAAA